MDTMIVHVLFGAIKKCKNIKNNIINKNVCIKLFLSCKK